MYNVVTQLQICQIRYPIFYLHFFLIRNKSLVLTIYIKLNNFVDCESLALAHLLLWTSISISLIYLLLLIFIRLGTTPFRYFALHLTVKLGFYPVEATLITNADIARTPVYKLTFFNFSLTNGALFFKFSSCFSCCFFYHFTLQFLRVFIVLLLLLQLNAFLHFLHSFFFLYVVSNCRSTLKVLLLCLQHLILYMFILNVKLILFLLSSTFLLFFLFFSLLLVVRFFTLFNHASEPVRKYLLFDVRLFTLFNHVSEPVREYLLFVVRLFTLFKHASEPVHECV